MDENDKIVMVGEEGKEDSSSPFAFLEAATSEVAAFRFNVDSDEIIAAEGFKPGSMS